MNSAEILNAISHGLMGPVIGIALAVCLWLWRRYQEAGPYSLRAEVLRLLGGVLPIAAGALLNGADWKTVMVVSLSALVSASGLNSKALPPVETSDDAPDTTPTGTEPKS